MVVRKDHVILIILLHIKVLSVNRGRGRAMPKYVKEKELRRYEADVKLSKKVKTAYLGGTITGQQAVAWLMTGGWSQGAAKTVIDTWREEAKPTDYYPQGKV